MQMEIPAKPFNARFRKKAFDYIRMPLSAKTGLFFNDAWSDKKDKAQI